MPDANTNLEKINEPVVSATEKKGKKPMVKPTLTKDDVIGKDHAENQNAVEQLADYEQAKTALEEVDVAHLFMLYEKAIKNRVKIEEAMMTCAEHWLDKDKMPRRQNDTALAAMERVALAAIDLAKSTCNGKAACDPKGA